MLLFGSGDVVVVAAAAVVVAMNVFNCCVVRFR